MARVLVPPALLFLLATSCLLSEGFSPASRSCLHEPAILNKNPAYGVPVVRSGDRASVSSLELSMVSEDESSSSGVVELADDDQEEEQEQPSQPPSSPSSAAPFLSQGEISEEALNPDLSDPKQTRVILYIIVSLLPVLFLVPFMLGSRDLIPLDEMPPVTM
mmetsp:Transcript_6122/g.13362  ORF Transcript_6122/g.13362 Transcript_6122/m.13362 type:complete len:162 (+) Transcript_6122:75-560(+)|eukprot:CAMPEP_0178504366 /NCGR_PEP_ID=MMETSP0696-20121128/18554_1 /TAXON_ID=265572 /ORGANISM="Extubocellulus spinifer, Strain CCMP396" /LENGTH=161 /DNA_ID=CAMNT_0020133595 /DNA_START=35 /DNA_END=520 /DNA_ORIENTATION=-